MMGIFYIEFQCYFEKKHIIYIYLLTKFELYLHFLLTEGENFIMVSYSINFLNQIKYTKILLNIFSDFFRTKERYKVTF